MENIEDTENRVTELEKQIEYLKEVNNILLKDIGNLNRRVVELEKKEQDRDDLMNDVGIRILGRHGDD